MFILICLNSEFEIVDRFWNKKLYVALDNIQISLLPIGTIFLELITKCVKVTHIHLEINFKYTMLKSII